jgi:hypothetical protein
VCKPVDLSVSKISILSFSSARSVSARRTEQNPHQEGISVCDRSNGHLILDCHPSARYNVHDSNTLGYHLIALPDASTKEASTQRKHVIIQWNITRLVKN